jgi:RND family efflux transporter MFP subunit
MSVTVRVVWVSLAALSLAACGGEKTAVKPPPPPVVEVAALRGGVSDQTLTASGVLERERESALSFRIPGVITRLTVDAGDRVTRGQVIAAIDPTGVQAQLARSASELEKARRELARDQALAERGFVSGQRLEDRKSTVRSMSAAYDAAAFDARWARLVSPVSGVVLERRAQTGEVVQPGQAVVVVADATSALLMRAAVPDREIGRIRPGMSATVSAPALGGRTLPGVVQTVGQQAGQQTGAVEVEVRVPADPALRSGMVVTAALPLGPGGASGAPGFLRAPAEAVLEADGGRAFVYRLSGDGKRVQRTAVTFGGFDGDDALIGGLPAGARVVTAGAGFVRDGQAVQVADPLRLASGTASPRP